MSNMYPSKKYPHYGVFVRNTVELLRSGGYKVTVCCIPKCDKYINKLITYGWNYAKCIILGTFGRYDCLYAHFISHTAIPARIVKKIHPNICLVENAHGNDVVIQTEEDSGKNIERSRKVLPLADRVIVPSSYFKQVLEKVYDYPEDKIFVSPSGGINHNIFFPINQQKAREHCKLKKDVFYIGLFGRITAGKGWSTFLSAIQVLQLKKLIPNLELLIVGSGDQDELLDRELEKLDLKNITVRRSFCEQKDLAYYYSALNLFVFASESKSESLGLVGLEAMACGVLCICSNNFAITTYAIDEVNCLMFEKENVNMLAKKIEKAYLLPDKEKNQILKNAIKTADQYDRGRVAEEFIAFFESII